MQSLITIDIVPVIKVRAAPALALAPLKHLHNLPGRVPSQFTPSNARRGVEIGFACQERQALLCSAAAAP